MSRVEFLLFLSFLEVIRVFVNKLVVQQRLPLMIVWWLRLLLLTSWWERLLLVCGSKDHQHWK